MSLAPLHTQLPAGYEPREYVLVVVRGYGHWRCAARLKTGGHIIDRGVHIRTPNGALLPTERTRKGLMAWLSLAGLSPAWFNERSQEWRGMEEATRVSLIVRDSV